MTSERKGKWSNDVGLLVIDGAPVVGTAEGVEVVEMEVGVAVGVSVGV